VLHPSTYPVLVRRIIRRYLRHARYPAGVDMGAGLSGERT
jgi:hypothetical protein